MVVVASGLAETLVASQLIQDAQAIGKQANTSPDLGGNLGVRFEDHVVNVEFLEHIGKRKSSDATAGDDDFETHDVG